MSNDPPEPEPEPADPDTMHRLCTAIQRDAKELAELIDELRRIDGDAPGDDGPRSG
jgi:hypothetical protein